MLVLLALLTCLAACGRPAGPPFLLLVTVDTLRADRLGSYGSALGLTPNLDALAAQSVVFDAAYAPAPFTLPSVVGILTGQHPESLGIWSNESQLPVSTPTLASELHARGWATAGVVGNWVLRASSGLAAGFDRYDDAFPQLEAVRQLPERTAADNTDAALRALDGLLARPAPGRFLWVHYQDPHGPYTPPADHRERYLEPERSAPDGRRELPLSPDHRGDGAIPDYQRIGDERQVAFYRAGYDGEVAYVDEQIGRLLAGLAERGLAEDALVVFAADHGESLGEHDLWFVHGQLLTPVLVHVPLWLRIPGAAPERRADVVSLTDAAPTLLALLAEAEHDGLPGRDLLAEGGDAPEATAYAASLGSGTLLRYTWLEGDYQYTLVRPRDVWEGTLVRRGREQLDLTAAAPQIARRMRARLGAFRRRFADAPAEIRQSLGEEELRRLRALGYVSDP